MATNKKRNTPKNMFRLFYLAKLKHNINQNKIEYYDMGLSTLEETYMDGMENMVKFIEKEVKEKSLNNDEIMDLYRNKCDELVEILIEIAGEITRDVVIPQMTINLINACNLINLDLFYIMPKNKVDKIMNEIDEQLSNSFMQYCRDVYYGDYTIYNKEIKDIIEENENFICENLYENLEDNNLYIAEERDNYFYIDNYRKLNKIAVEKGFDLIRSRGDHGIFKNSEGFVVVIPQGRRIGKGLSFKIQKNLDGIGIDNFWNETEIAL